MRNRSTKSPHMTNDLAHQQKVCAKCRQSFPVGHFRVLGKSGQRISYCRDCERAYRHEYRSRPEVKAKRRLKGQEVLDGAKSCSRCGEEKPRARFPRWGAKCRDCIQARRKAYESQPEVLLRIRL